MGYWDTSTLVKLYAKEPDSALFEVQALSGPAGSVTSRIALYEARASFQRNWWRRQEDARRGEGARLLSVPCIALAPQTRRAQALCASPATRSATRGPVSMRVFSGAAMTSQNGFLEVTAAH